MLGLALDGAALVSSGQVDEGMRCLDEATSVALENEASIPIANAWTFCILVTSCTTVHDYVRAVEWTDRIAEFAERYGSRYMLAFCRAHYGAVQLWHGQVRADAEAELVRGDDFGRSRPAWAAAPLLELAELRRRQGRASEAAQLLDEAGLVGEAGLCRARLALDRGDARSGRRPDGAPPAPAPGHTSDRAAPALELLVHARSPRGELEEASSALEKLRTSAKLFGTAALRRRPAVPRAPWRRQRGDHDRARQLLEDAGRRLRAVRRSVRGGCGADPARHKSLRARSGGVCPSRGQRCTHRFAELGAEAEAQRARRMLSHGPPHSARRAHATRARGARPPHRGAHE